MKLPEIAADKLGHFFWGQMIALAVFVLASIVGWKYSWLAPTIAAVIAGAAKEFRDMGGKGHVELADFAWTVAGGAVISAVSWSAA